MDTHHPTSHDFMHKLRRLIRRPSHSRLLSTEGKTMDRSTRFWDKIADRYSRKPVADEAAYQNKLAITREYLHPEAEVLEIGCGTGSTAIAHAPFVKQILATDISARMIEIAKEKAEAQDIDNVTFERLAIDELQVPDESYDAVLGLSILHLLENKDEVIAKVHQMLKPGGVFVSSTACLGDSMKFFKYIGPVGRFLGLIPYVAIFSQQEFVDSLTSAGFEIDYQWRPGKGKAVFIVAKKTG
jgi:2-polyprenyl-3-methyl-5-hydroxy-6-metoxy-1,4-benzoquinol methylase